MIYNFLFLLIVAYAIWVKRGELCSECTVNKTEQIFQIVIVAISSYIFVGAENIVKLMAIILLSFIIKGIIFYIPKKITDCYYCHDSWKRSAGGIKK